MVAESENDWMEMEQGWAHSFCSISLWQHHIQPTNISYHPWYFHDIYSLSSPNATSYGTINTLANAKNKPKAYKSYDTPPHNTWGSTTHHTSTHGMTSHDMTWHDMIITPHETWCHTVTPFGNNAWFLSSGWPHFTINKNMPTNNKKEATRIHRIDQNVFAMRKEEKKSQHCNQLEPPPFHLHTASQVQ